MVLRNVLAAESQPNQNQLQGNDAQNSVAKKRKVTKASILRRKRGEWSTHTADNRFSIFIRDRDGRCRRCGTSEGLTCSHYHLRKHSATRFDPKNCIALCWTCHMLWEGPKNGYTEFMLDWLGEAEFIQLALRAGSIKPRKEAVAEWKALYATLSSSGT